MNRVVDSSREELGESVGRGSNLLQRRMHSRNSTMLDAFPMHDDISFLCAAHGNRQSVPAKPSRTRTHTSQNHVAKKKDKHDSDERYRFIQHTNGANFHNRHNIVVVLNGSIYSRLSLNGT